MKEPLFFSGSFVLNYGYNRYNSKKLKNYTILTLKKIKTIIG
jgi:hypothetical protein